MKLFWVLLIVCHPACFSDTLGQQQRVTFQGDVSEVIFQANFSRENFPSKSGVSFFLNHISRKHFAADKCVSKKTLVVDHNYKMGHEGANCTQKCVVTQILGNAGRLLWPEDTPAKTSLFWHQSIFTPFCFSN